MTTQKNEYSYYKVKLRELLRSSFPELASNTKFIEDRSNWAAKAYEGAFMAGNPVEECDRIADAILFENLHFSKYDTVFRVVCEEFDTLMADDDLRPFALKMLPICKPVFARYELTENFQDSPEYDRLYSELTGTIQIFIEQNGLQ
ncbi:protein of unknown function [Chitinophaga eiseniae]|uniref:DUF1896 domain-containing protein n=1 Tax=Chitinophaga eiseniae TaxID=634771 RepID=A0A1T4SYF5_9BACT|nr:DUF1896 domain-containing protein [Chitinophaga eiseniae]SKA32941.1 protein of unknown function [Chitinophaga eiseniae]